MARRIEIPISTPYNPKGATDAARALTALAKAEQAAATASSKTAQAQNQAGVSGQKLAVAQNQAAISAQKLAQAELATAGALIKNEAAMSKAALSALRLEQAQAKASQGGKSLSQTLGGLQSAAGALGLAFGAQQLAAGAIELAKTGAQAQLVTTRFNALAAAAGETGDALLGALRKASGGEISDLNLQLAANRANLLGVATSAEQLGTLMAIARDRAQNLGTTATDAFNDLVVGLGRGSRLILDNLGIIVDADAANAAYAATIGKTVAQLTEAERKQALINQVVADGKASMEATGGAADSAASSYARLGTAAENAGAKIGVMLAEATKGTADDLATGINRLMQGTDGLREAWDAAITSAQANTAAQMAYAAAIEAGQSPTEAAQAATWAYKEVVDAATEAHSKGTTGGTTWGQAQVDAAADAQLAAAAIGEMITQTLTDADAKTAAEEKARAFAEAQDVIARLGGAVHAGLTTSAEGALILADRYGIAYAQALLLIDAQARIAGGNARLAGQKRNTLDLVPGGVGVSAPGKRGQSDADILATVTKTTEEITAVGVRAQPIRTAAVKAGGGARAAAEKSTADKIKEIAQQTADKLVAIDQKAAEQRASALRSLAASVSTTSADMVASQEANDLELVGASEDRLAELSAREAAEAQARIASIEAVKEARAIADAGDAEQAQAVLEQRQQQISQQQSLDEEYAKRRAELAGDPAATEALKTQYDEATQALADATQVRIDLAAQEAQQRAEALAAEKAAVTDAAAAQVAALGGTGAAADTAKGKVDNLGSAIASLPTHTVLTVEVREQRTTSGAPAEANRAAVSAPNTSGGSGGSGGSKGAGAGGGQFVTSGPATLTVGDNPGGVEIVNVTPVSGVGRSSVSGPNIHMAGGGTATIGDDAAIRRLEEANKRAIIPSAARAAGGGGGSTKRAAEAAAKEEKAAKPAIADYTKAAKDNLDLLSETLKLRTIVQDPATWMPINDAVLESAARDADKVARRFADIAATYEGPVLENAKLYSDALGGTFGVIKDGLETFDRLKGSEALDIASLRTFEQGAMATIDAVGRLGAQAATIPEASVSALGNIASTLAVLPSLGLLGGGGGGATTNMGGINIAIYQQPGQDSQALVRQVMQAINTQQGTRR